MFKRVSLQLTRCAVVAASLVLLAGCGNGGLRHEAANHPSQSACSDVKFAAVVLANLSVVEQQVAAVATGSAAADLASTYSAGQNLNTDANRATVAIREHHPCAARLRHARTVLLRALNQASWAGLDVEGAVAALQASGKAGSSLSYYQSEMRSFRRKLEAAARLMRAETNARQGHQTNARRRHQIVPPQPGDTECGYGSAFDLTAGKCVPYHGRIRSDKSKVFDSPTGNIQCYLAAPSGGASVYCLTLRPGRGVNMDANGRMTLCSGDCRVNGFTYAFTLRYGRSVHLGAITCTSRMNGMRCAAMPSGRGFEISRERIARFSH